MPILSRLTHCLVDHFRNLKGNVSGLAIGLHTKPDLLGETLNPHDRKWVLNPFLSITIPKSKVMINTASEIYFFTSVNSDDFSKIFTRDLHTNKM